MNHDISIAVLTGDLVHSTELGPDKIDRAFEALEACAARLEGWQGHALHFSRHRGDGWQVVLMRPEQALRCALAFRASLRALGDEFDTYIGIAEGRNDGPIGRDLNDETGPVFVSSGSTLAIPQYVGPMRMAHAAKGPMDAVTHLADQLSMGWTPPQAAAVLPFLDPHSSPSYTQVAKALGKSRQAVKKAVDAAHLPALIYALNSLEETPHD